MTFVTASFFATTRKKKNSRVGSFLTEKKFRALRGVKFIENSRNMVNSIVPIEANKHYAIFLTGRYEIYPRFSQLEKKLPFFFRDRLAR